MKKYAAAVTLAAALLASAAATSLAASKRHHRREATPAAHHQSVPVTREAAPGLPDQTIYRPTYIRPGTRLPVVLWENGGCADSNGSEAVFLTNLAASGFLVIAHGPVTNLPTTLPPTNPLLDPNPPIDPPAAAAPNPGLPFPDYYTTFLPNAITQMKSVLNWVEKSASSTLGSPYYHELDLSEIATSGWSCGGTVAIAVAAADPRVDAVLGYDTASSSYSYVSDPLRQALLNLHAPIAWIMGGTSDIAYPGFQADWAMPFKAPAFEAEHMYMGHTGLWQAVDSQQLAAKIGAGWLDLTVKHNPWAGRYLLGTPCGFCTNPYWSTKQKNWPRDWSAGGRS